ncbi:hypothetical protein [Amycolatopsis sp. lyj-109]|uniref:hypothetical protein n=1 Tax=Amycolatopsis sp. lyj-109 TaxID=2789287 RepID=UPI00397B1E5B
MRRPLLFLDVDGPRLPALGCDLVWATTWPADPNECIAPLLGLPPLPVLDFPDEGIPGLHWKTGTIVTRAAGRPFAWVDETTDADRVWVASHHPGPALLHTVGASTGLTGQDLATIATWLTTVA